jgi:hypothetical protein
MRWVKIFHLTQLAAGNRAEAQARAKTLKPVMLELRRLSARAAAV